jgi:ribA/ribD-fused uncharacterized protein
MKTKAAVVAKKLGRQVRNYDDQIWREKRFAAMVDALKLKFVQNDELRVRLLATGVKQLYEAAARDAIWGIGLGVNQISNMFREDESFQRSGDVDAETQRECFGSNLLGRALMETREWLRTHQQHEKKGEKPPVAPSAAAKVETEVAEEQVHDLDSGALSTSSQCEPIPH